MGAKIGVLLNCGQQSQFSKVRREFDAGRVNLDPPMTCADWPVPGNLTLLHPQTAYTLKPWHRDKDISDYRNCGKIRVPSRRCLEVSFAPAGGGGGDTNSPFLRFFVRSVPLFHSLMLTPMEIYDNNLNYYHQHGSTIIIVYCKHITHAHTPAHTPTHRRLGSGCRCYVVAPNHDGVNVPFSTLRRQWPVPASFK